MEAVDALCKKLQDPDIVDNQLRFIYQIFDETEEFEYEEINDEKDDKVVPKKKDKVIKEDSDSNDNEDSDDEGFEEELETSQYGNI